jgi:hypothetical protein
VPKLKLLMGGLLLIVLVGMTPLRAEADNQLMCITIRPKPGCSFGLPTFQYEILLGQMTAHPVPNVRPLDVDVAALGHSDLPRVIGGNTALYDAPNGKFTGFYDVGFQHIRVGQQQGDWIELYKGRWMHARSLTYATSSTFTGVMTEDPLLYPMAWVLQPTQPASVAGYLPPPTAPVLERYTRVNLYTTLTIDSMEWYLVGPGQWLNQYQIARLIPAEKPKDVKGRWIAVNLEQQTLTAYEDNKLIFATLVSTGLPKTGFGTDKGLFNIWLRAVEDRMSGGMGPEDYYNLPDVPYVMYFNRDMALHGAYWHDDFGYRRSHGCVNLSLTDARWLYEWTDNFYADSWVYVYATRTRLK